jgi:hypothetical protein
MSLLKSAAVAIGWRKIQAEDNSLLRQFDVVCLEVEGAPEQSLEFIGIQRITIAA